MQTNPSIDQKKQYLKSYRSTLWDIHLLEDEIHMFQSLSNTPSYIIHPVLSGNPSVYLYRGRSYRTDTSSLKIHSWRYTGSNCRDTQLQSTTDSQHPPACTGTSFASAFRKLTQDHLFLKREKPLHSL